MKTSKEFFERIKSDEIFAEEIAEKIKEKSGDYKEILIPVAAEYDYELTEAELDELYNKQSAELTDEELEKVSGGGTPFLILASFITAGLTLTCFADD